ncbi:MAG: hypothetical protein ACRCTO_21550 [Pseudomonas paracarnis]
MTVEAATSISQLDPNLPASGDPKSEGDNHLRLLKSVLQTQFPNFGTNAITVTAAEVNYLGGVTSGIQPQLNAKGAITGQAWTGTHDFTGATITVPTATAGDSSNKPASTAFVAALAFSAALPGQTGNAGRVVRTNGVTASWGSDAGVVSIVSTNTAAQNGYFYVLTATLVLTLPASPTAGDRVTVVNRSGTATPSIGRNGQNIMGLAEDMTLDNINAAITLVYADATRGWVLS